MGFFKVRVSRPVLSAISLALLAGLLAAVMTVALLSPLKDDIAWLLYVARRWMAGRELYVDVVEVNPPLIIWISAIPLQLARWLHVDPQNTALPAFAAVALGSAWWSACLLRPIGGLFAARAPVFSVIGAVLLLIPAADLGQREHLLIAGFLPYLVLFARNLSGERLPASTAVPVGVAAALGCALKPQYGLAFAALEAVALCHRTWPWRPAPLAAGLTLSGYVALVALVCPAYFHGAVPMAMALYGATDVSFRALLLACAPLLAAEALALALWWSGRSNTADRAVERSLLLAGLTFAPVSSLICFMDGKDWFYHRIPATVTTMLVLILWAADLIRRDAGAVRRHWRPLAAAGLAVVLFTGAAAVRLEPEVRQAVEPKATTVARLEALIRLHHAHSYMAFSEWIALGFPVVNHTGVVWASRFDSMWALKGEMWRAHIDPVAAREWPVGRWVSHDFIRTCPDIVVVDTRGDVNYIRILSAADQTFAHAWARYRQLLSFDGLTVYKRHGTGCVDPWLAAQGPAPLETKIR
jgi:hypothetical protein